MEAEAKGTENINYLLTKEVDVLVVVSDSIIEYCLDLFENINVPVVNIVDECINYVNVNYEYKNLGFLATTSIIEANIYQKYFRYNHLYNMNGDNLKQLIRNQLVKTTETFQEAKNVIAQVYKKDLDLIIPSLINYLMVKTEINEFLKDVEIVPIDDVVCNKIIELIYKDEVLPVKGKGKTYVCLNHSNIDLNQINRLVKIKYTIIDVNQENSK